MVALALASAGASFAIGAMFLPLWIRILTHRRILDYPNARSSHERATPRGAGLAVALAACAPQAFGANGDVLPILAFILAITLVGFLEDLRTLPIRVRIVLQASTSLVAAGFLPLAGAYPPALAVALTVACASWLVVLVNTYNFMDGVNGISAFNAIVVAVTFAYAASLEHDPTLVRFSGAVAGAIVAFLPFNWPRARVFLGDSGSYFLGGAIAFCSLRLVLEGAPPWLVIAPIVVYLTDVSVTLFMRIGSGERWWEAHKGHTYQRLVAQGLTHGQVSLWTAGLSLACALGAAGTRYLPFDFRAITATAVAIACSVAYLQSPKFLAFERLATDG